MGLPGKIMGASGEVFPVVLIFPDNKEVTIEAGAEQHIWDAAAAAGFALPALCHQGYCLTCAGRLECGDVDQSDSLVYYPEDREAGFVLPCTGKPRSPLRIRTHKASAMRAFRREKGLLAPYSWTDDQR
jgi:ferredoxin